MITIIILGAIIIWYLTGFHRSRRIDRENNHKHAWGLGKKVLGYIDGDKGLLPWVSLPYPFKKIDIKSFWSFSVPLNQKIRDEAGNIINLPLKNSVGKPINYSDPQEIKGLNFKIVTANDVTNKIRKNARFLFQVTVRFPDAGISFEVILGVVFNIFRPMGLLKLQENILDYAQGEVDDAIEPWFVGQEIEQKTIWEQKTTLATGNLDQKQSQGIHMIQWMEKFRIDDVEKIIVADNLNFRDYLEQKKFKKFGFKFKELSLFLGYGDSVIKLLTERQEQQKQAEERNTNIAKEKAKVVTRITQVNDSAAKRDAKKLEWEIEEKILDKLALAQGIVNESFKATTLVLNGNGNNLMDSFTGSLIGTRVNTNQPAQP